MTTPLLSIIIPCLNEEATLPYVLNNIKTVLHSCAYPYEIILADNGSLDTSITIAHTMGAKVVHTQTKGYGATLRNAFLHAKGTYTIFADADGSYDFKWITPLLEKLEDGYDFVSGSRFLGSIEAGAMPFLHQYIGTPFLTFLINTLFGTHSTDSNSGLKAFRTQCIKHIQFQATGMEFISELIIVTHLQGYRWSEIPIHFYKDKRSSRPHLRTFRDGMRNLYIILKLFFTHKLPSLFS